VPPFVLADIRRFGAPKVQNCRHDLDPDLKNRRLFSNQIRLSLDVRQRSLAGGRVHCTLCGMNAHDRRVWQPLERVAGAARLVCVQRGAGTAIEDLYQKAPCRLLFPDAEADDPFTAVLLTTSGGLTGGDRLDIEIGVGRSAAATMTTQAAEKIYRSMGDDCTVRIRLNIGSDAWAEWLMQETILFDGARLSRRTEADVAASGRLLAVESLVFGRGAMGESFDRGRLHDDWRIRREGKLVWADAVKLEGDVAAERHKPFGLGNAAGCATLIYVGPDAAHHLASARDTLAQTEARGGASSFDGLLIVRLLADDAAHLRGAVAHCVKRLRATIAGLPERMPTVWSV
jgi:urease accessory protein